MNSMIDAVREKYSSLFFFFNDTATTEIYTLSLHDALPISDLREGIPTLPTLLASKSTDPADARLLELLESDLHDGEALAEVLQLLRRHPSIDQAREEVHRRAEQARSLLQPLPSGPARDALEALCTTVVTRSA